MKRILIVLTLFSLNACDSDIKAINKKELLN